MRTQHIGLLGLEGRGIYIYMSFSKVYFVCLQGAPELRYCFSHMAAGGSQRGGAYHEAISGRVLYAAWCVLRHVAWSMSCACKGSKMSQSRRAKSHCPTGATPARWTLRPPTSSHHPRARMPSLTCRICPLQVYSRSPSTPVGISSISTTTQCKVHEMTLA